MITSKTSSEHATADVDDERGRNFIGQEAGMNGPSNLHSGTADTCLCSITGMSNTMSMNGTRGKSNSKNCWNLSLQGHRNVTASQYLKTALGWRYSSSLRRKRREVKRRDARVPVPVIDLSLLIPFAVPHDLDTSWSPPDCTVSTSVPEESLASVAFPEPHPLDGVLQLSSQRGWARLGEQFRPRVRSHLRTFFLFWEKCENPLCQAHLRVLHHQLESEKKMNHVLGENQEDVRLKQDQRSAPQSAQKCVSWRKASLLNCPEEKP